MTSIIGFRGFRGINYYFTFSYFNAFASIFYDMMDRTHLQTFMDQSSVVSYSNIVSFILMRYLL